MLTFQFFFFIFSHLFTFVFTLCSHYSSGILCTIMLYILFLYFDFFEYLVFFFFFFFSGFLSFSLPFFNYFTLIFLLSLSFFPSSFIYSHNKSFLNLNFLVFVHLSKHFFFLGCHCAEIVFD